MALNEQITPGYLPDNFRGKDDEFWTPVPEGELVAVGCGDDRRVTEKSAGLIDRYIAPGTMSIDKGFASIYGGAVGVEHNFLVAGVAAHGERFINTIEGVRGVEGIVDTALDKLAMLHSDTSKEENDYIFNHFLGCEGVGCAYCMLRGATSYYLDADPSKPQEDRAIITNIVEVAQENQHFIFGHQNEELVEKLMEGNRIVAQYLGGLASKKSGIVDARGYSVDREEYKRRKQENGTFVAILEGSHVTAPKTGLIFNADINSVGNANEAVKAGVPMYRSDFLSITNMMGDVLNAHNIQTELFARAIALNATPVRAALVSHDSDPELAGRLDPTPLAIGVRGNVRENLNTLAERYDAFNL